jgi:hypothetical protein
MKVIRIFFVGLFVVLAELLGNAAEQPPLSR